ncbi:hypothetical protein GEV39_13065 [Pseudomonas sp. NY5710]|nr:hypothetical protein GEV39_13065 [Pseudomonas sp. NY5710]
MSFSKFEKPVRFIVEAGLPAKQATRFLAPAAPVFAGKPAPTRTRPLRVMQSPGGAPAFLQI